MNRNVLSPIAYQGISEARYRARNINFADFTVTTLAAGASGTTLMTISTSGPFMLTSFQVIVVSGGSANLAIKPFDASGKEIFTDFVTFLDSVVNVASDPFPIIPMRIFDPLSRIRIDYKNNSATACNFEVILRGIEVISQ